MEEIINEIQEEIIDEVAIERQTQLDTLYTNLIQTDYKIMKYVEGKLTEQEYASIKAQRQAWRDEINRLEVHNKVNN